MQIRLRLPLVRIVRMVVAFVLVTATAGYAQDTREGMVDVEGGKVWYHIVGDGAATPVVVLHGGPGIPSIYLKPLEGLSKDRPVVFYDQLGCGNSPAADDTSLWTIEHFVKELSQVREALELSEIHLYGHSWGAMLAIEYMKTNPTGVKSLVLAGPALDMEQWVKDTGALLRTLPEETQAVIERHETAGTTDSEEYQGAMMQFYGRFVARKQPWEDYLMKAFETMNPAIYGHMCGPSEFAITGTLKGLDASTYLPSIDVPTLFVGGQYDEAVPATLLAYQALTPGSEVAVVPGAAHLAWHDAPDSYLATLGEYLRRVDAP